MDTLRALGACVWPGVCVWPLCSLRVYIMISPLADWWGGLLCCRYLKGGDARWMARCDGGVYGWMGEPSLVYELMFEWEEAEEKEDSGKVNRKERRNL